MAVVAERVDTLLVIFREKEKEIDSTFVAICWLLVFLLFWMYQNLLNVSRKGKVKKRLSLNGILFSFASDIYAYFTYSSSSGKYDATLPVFHLLQYENKNITGGETQRGKNNLSILSSFSLRRWCCRETAAAATAVKKIVCVDFGGILKFTKICCFGGNGGGGSLLL